MKKCLFAVLGILLLPLSGIATAQQSSVPASFAYNVKMGTGSGPSVTLALSVAVQSTASDGSRQAEVTVHIPWMRPLDGKRMNATLSPFGAIQIASTGDINKSYSQMQVAAESQAASGPMVQNFISPLDTFADALAAAPSQKAGTSWHAAAMQFVDVVYTITAHQQQNGRDTLSVTWASQGTGPAINGQGNYDPVAHLVVSLHSELRQAAGGQAAVTDIAMAP